MKKFRVLLSIACLLCSMLGSVGCGKTGNERITLKLAVREGTYGEVIKSCLADFEEEHQVSCVVDEYSEADLKDAIKNNTNRYDAYDLCMVDGSWMAEFCEEDLLADLSEYGYALDSDIIAATTQVCFYEGDVYLAPFYGNVTVLMYNKQILSEAGYTIKAVKDLTDVYNICEYAKEHGKNGFLYRGDTNNNLVVDYLPILLSYGGWVVDENFQPILTEDYDLRAMEFYQKLVATGTAMPRDDLMQALKNGEGAMAIGWPGWYMADDADTIGYCALSGRANPNGPAYNSNVYGIWTLGVPKNSPNKEEAIALLEHLMDPQNQLESVAYGGVPCRYSALLNEDVLKTNPHYEEICNALESGQYRPIMSNWNDFSEVLGGYMREIMDGTYDVPEGMAAAQEELLALTTKE
ncbi:MAG: extracellular solute-binding protein [Lachnospiraceae bacterium]|nr:extracellular solute-binding protein [Lachnospiraceae bacterium]